jgi:hypothetical protein
VSEESDRQDRERQVMVQTYRVLSGVALLVIVLLELADGLSLTVPFVLLFGLMGIVWRVPAAPGLVLLFFAIGQFFRSQFLHQAGNPFRRFGIPPYPPVEMPDLVLAGAMVAFFAAQLRLNGLRGLLLPADLRRRRRAGLGAQHEAERGEEFKRPRRVVSLHEAPTLVLTLPLWVLLGQVLWLVIAADRGGEFEPEFLRIVTLVWLVGVPTLVVGSLLHFWNRSSMSPEEAQIFLQDTLWRQTAREQRRVTRFLAWARLRQKRREEAR